MADMEVSDFVGSVGRTAAAVVSGVLIARGLPPELVAAVMDPGTAVIIGGIGYAATQVHSLWSKWTAEKPKATIAVLKVSRDGQVTGAVETQAEEIKPLS